MKKIKGKINSIFKTKRNIILFFAFLLLTIYYLSFTMSIFWDTGHYMSYVEILERKAPFSTWDIVRGPIFPLIIYFSNILFGKTTQGIIILSFLFYLIMLYGTKKILDKALEKKEKYIYITIFLFIIINPLIFGYYHTLLTEFVAMTLSVIMCYLSWKWLDIDFKESKRNFILIAVFFVIMSIISWHLKQPYVSVSLFPIGIATLISIIKNRSLRNIVERISVFVICLIGVVASIVCWNKILVSKNIDLNTSRNVTASLGKQLTETLTNHKIITSSNEEEIIFLSEKEKEKLKENDYFLVNIYNLDKELIDQTIIKLDSLGNLSTSSSFQYILKSFIHHPLLVIEPYISNYLAIADIYPKVTDDSVSYYVGRKIDLLYCHENCTISLRITKEQSNIIYMLEEARARVKDYEQQNNSPIIFRGILSALAPISQMLFKILILCLPLFVIFSTISFFKKKNKTYANILNIVLILLWYSFLHIMLHVVTGANIDRYAAPTIITSFIGMVLYIYFLLDKKLVGRKNEKR